MISAILIISFLLDGVLSNYFSLDGIFIPLFSLIGLVVSYGYFNSDNSKFYIIGFVLGLCYDLIYTDTFVFYASLFLFISFIIVKISKVLASNYLNLIIVSVICIVLFRIITYMLLVITGNVVFNFDSLYRGIYSSIIINIIYGFIVKFICNQIVAFKKRRKRFY